MNRAPSPAGMTTAKDEVEEAPPMGCCAKMAKEMKKLGPQWRKREVYGKGKDGVKVVVRLNLTMYGGQGCFGPRQMLRRADMTKTPRALEADWLSSIGLGLTRHVCRAEDLRASIPDALKGRIAGLRSPDDMVPAGAAARMANAICRRIEV